MCESSGSGATPNKKQTRNPCFVSAAVGRTAQADAIAFADGHVSSVAISKRDAICASSAVAEKCAEGVADALLQTYSSEDHLSVFVVAGPGFNGLVGAYTAVLLGEKGFKPTVYRLEGQLPQSGLDVCAMLREKNIPVCDFAPRTLDFYFDLVVDALLGVGFDGADIRPQYWNIFEMMVHTELPILSIDIPSGWDLDTGPRQIDVTANTFLQPEVLVSLGVAKNGAKMFAGSFHFVGGRHLPPGWGEGAGVELPAYRDGDSSALLSSNAFGSINNGEVYGKPGKFEATLWDNKSRRKWVSDEEMDELDMWDELD